MENPVRGRVLRRIVRVAGRDVTLEASRWFPLSLLAMWAVVLVSFVVLDRLLPSGSSLGYLVASSVAGTLLFLATVVVHEAGHVIAAELVGHRWVLTQLGVWGVGVGLDSDKPRGWERITRSLAGPAAQILCAAPLALTIFGEPLLADPGVLMPFQSETLWFPGLLGLSIGLINLLPLGRLDGAKAASGMRDLRDTRRNRRGAPDASLTGRDREQPSCPRRSAQLSGWR